MSRAQVTVGPFDLTPQLLRVRIALGSAIPYARGAMVGERRRDRQAVRLLSIFLLLLQGSRLTVHELAARFKTRRETIYRDLRTLGDVGIPIEGDESGRLSRPRLSADYRLGFAPVPLTRQEIVALAWAVKESHTRQPFQAALSTALPKLQTFASARDGRLTSQANSICKLYLLTCTNPARPGPRSFIA